MNKEEFAAQVAAHAAGRHNATDWVSDTTIAAGRTARVVVGVTCVVVIITAQLAERERIIGRLKYHYQGTHRVEEAGHNVYIRYA